MGRMVFDFTTFIKNLDYKHVLRYSFSNPDFFLQQWWYDCQGLTAEEMRKLNYGSVPKWFVNENNFIMLETDEMLGVIEDELRFRTSGQISLFDRPDIEFYIPL